MANLIWPNDLGGSKVVWNLNLMAADGHDENRDPELMAAEGLVVSFTPDIDAAVRYQGEMGNRTIMPMISKGVIDDKGDLCTMNDDGSPGPVGVILPATDSETITPRGWTYRATVTENRIRVDEYSFHAPSDAEVDLALVAPIDPDGGTHIVTEVETAERAESAASDAERYRNETRTDRQAAQTARTGAETAETNAKTHATDAASSASSAADILTATEALGITVDTSVGERVFVGDTMIYGDTGWRDITDMLVQGWVADKVLIRRVNYIVEMYVQGLDATGAAGHSFIIGLPTEFRPYVNAVMSMTISSTNSPGGNPVLFTSIGSQGQTIRASVTDSEGVSYTDAHGSLSWLTDAPWGDTLPGVDPS